MDIKTLRKNYKAQILEIAAICNAEDVQVFGSIASNESYIVTEKSLHALIKDRALREAAEL